MTKCECKHSIVLINTWNVLNKGTLICTTHNPCFMIFLSMAFQAAQSWQCRPISSPWERFLDGGLSRSIVERQASVIENPYRLLSCLSGPRAMQLLPLFYRPWHPHDHSESLSVLDEFCLWDLPWKLQRCIYSAVLVFDKCTFWKNQRKVMGTQRCTL